MMHHRELFTFMHERHRIYQRRLTGAPKPWTKDPILQQYRFSNAYRELDKTTVWIKDNWRTPHQKDDHVWFAMAVARYINWPDTMQHIGYPVPWNAKQVCRLLNLRKYEGRQIFGGAYFLNSVGPKIESIVNDRLTPLWDNYESITTLLYQAQTLKEVYEVLLQQHGFGSFMAAQVVADLKYTPHFKKMKDWWSWAAPGPGSMRGMARVNGIRVTANHWLDALGQLQTLINPLVSKAGMPRLHAQDLQSWLCEFDKFERVRLGEGRPKQKYNGGA